MQAKKGILVPLNNMVEHQPGVVVKLFAERLCMHGHHRLLHFGLILYKLQHEIEIGHRRCIIELQGIGIKKNKPGTPKTKAKLKSP